MLSFPSIKLTPAQTDVTNEIINSYNTSTPVTDKVWNNFLLYSPRYYPLWTQTIALTV